MMTSARAPATKIFAKSSVKMSRCVVVSNVSIFRRKYQTVKCVCMYFFVVDFCKQIQSSANSASKINKYNVH